MPREEHTNPSHDVERDVKREFSNKRLHYTNLFHNIEDENQIEASNHGLANSCFLFIKGPK